MKGLKQFRKIFFSIHHQGKETYLISKTSSNYLVISLALIGFICCFLNAIILGSVIFIIIFIIMNIKSAVYYDIYKVYYKQKYQMEEIGSKYSLKHPKTLVIYRG